MTQNPVVEGVAVVDEIVEGATQIDLDERAAVGLLCLEELVPVVAPSVLPVVELVEGVSEDPGETLAVGVGGPEGRDDRIARFVVRLRPERKLQGVDHRPRLL